MANETTEKDLLKLFQDYVRITTRKYVDKEDEKETGTKKDYISHLNRFPFGTIDKILSVNEVNKNGWKVEKIQTNKKKKADNKSNIDEVDRESPKSDESGDYKSATYEEYYNDKDRIETDETTYWLYCKYKDDEDNIFALPKSKQTPKYLSLIIDFYKKGDLQYARTIASIVLRIAQKANSLIDKYENRETLIRKNGEKNTTWGNEVALFGKKLSALKKFVEFLNYDPNLEQNATPYSDEEIKKLRNSIKRDRIDKIDGAKELAKILGGEIEFIKYAIEQCYFFDPIIVYDRMIKLAYDLSLSGDDAVPVPARKTTKEDTSQSYKQVEYPKDSNKFYFKTIGQNQYTQLIGRDKDGNQAVRDLIKKYTGYTIGEGQGSIFKNYVISHVWGKAYDPRYFTNFANIVLVPAWANGLMDKVANDEGSLESILQSTLMAICHELYCKKWDDTLDDKIKGNIDKMKSDVENKKNQKEKEIANKKKLIQKKENENAGQEIIEKKKKELMNLEKSLNNYKQAITKLGWCLTNWENIWKTICDNIPIENLTVLHEKDVQKHTIEKKEGKKQKVPYKYNINLIHNHGWEKLEIPDPYHESTVGYINKMKFWFV